MKTMPTIEMVMEAYRKFAAVERMRMEKPCEKTVESAVGGTRRLCEIGGISLDQPISVFSRRRLEHIADIVRNSSLKKQRDFIRTVISRHAASPENCGSG